MKKIIIFTAFIVCFIACNNSQEQPATNAKNKNSAVPSPQKAKIKTVGILLYDGYAVLDAMGPYHVLSELMGVNVFFVGRHKGIVTTANEMKVQCDTSIAEVKQLDILVIPGGLNDTYKATKDTALLNWVRAIDATSTFTTSVCTGAWILGAAGLLKDREATTHWYGKKMLASEFGAKVVNKRFVKSGKYWTSAGVTAGMDMSLGLINEIKGEQYTKTVMLDLEYDPQPPFPGGSEQKTDPTIVAGLRKMYDDGLGTALHPEKAFTNINFENKKDYICGMPLTAGVADTANYQGKIYGFCSSGCKDEFKKNPESYLTLK